MLTFGAPTGYLDGQSWTVSGVSGDGWLSSVASLHEAAHAGLNFSTAWGHLLQLLWLLPARGEALGELVRRCVRTHEAYATHVAVIQVSGRGSAPDAGRIVAQYPAYSDHFQEALNLGPPVPATRAWRAYAVEAALEACMQADVLTTLFEAGVGGFKPSSLSDRQSPDSRLNALLEMGVGLWDGFEQAAAATFGGQRWEVLRSADLPGASGIVEAAERIRLRRLCGAHAAQRLRAAGRSTLTASEVQSALPRIVGEITRAPGYAAPPPIIDQDPTTLFDMERLRLRSPLPAQVRDFGEAEPGLLAGGDRPGESMLLTVRRAGVLRQQFALRDDSLPADDEPVVAVTARSAGELTLYRVQSPAALPAVGLANIALTCARNQVWRESWKDAFDRVPDVTLLLDTPFSQTLDALLTGTTGFRYAVEPLLDGTPLYAYVCGVDNTPPLVLPCTVTRASALWAHSRSRTGGQEPAALGDVVDSPEAVLAMASRIVADESVLDHYAH